MAQRIVCRFCEWYTTFEGTDDYEAARDSYDVHLDEHIEQAKEELTSDEFAAVICEQCKITHLVPHCEGGVCLWILCPYCKVVTNEHGNVFTYSVKRRVD